MRTAILKQIADRAKVLNRLEIIAETLPEAGPTPFMVSDLDDGQFIFSGPHQVDRVHAAFGQAGWRRVGRKYGTVSHVKELACGVVVTIENAEPIAFIDEPIETASVS